MIKKTITTETRTTDLVDFDEEVKKWLEEHGFVRREEKHSYTPIITTRYYHKELPIFIETTTRQDDFLFGDYQISFVQNAYFEEDKASETAIRAEEYLFDQEMVLAKIFSEYQKANELAIKFVKYVSKGDK